MISKGGPAPNQYKLRQPCLVVGTRARYIIDASRLPMEVPPSKTPDSRPLASAGRSSRAIAAEGPIRPVELMLFHGLHQPKRRSTER